MNRNTSLIHRTMMISFTAVKSLIQVELLGHFAAAIVLCMLFSILTRGYAVQNKDTVTSVHNSIVNYKKSTCLFCEFAFGNPATGCFFTRLQMPLNRRLKSLFTILLLSKCEN